MIVLVHEVMKYSVRPGQNSALLSPLRGIAEPYNYGQKIIGFNSLANFPDVIPEGGD